MTTTKLAPTVDVIDAWLARTKKFNADGSQKFATEYAHYGVNIWTKGSRARCITDRVVSVEGLVGYDTIVGEGSSNGSRHYIIWAPQIIRAEGWVVGEDTEMTTSEIPVPVTPGGA